MNSGMRVKNKIALGSKKISLIVYDFDGVMTDNRVMVSEDGTESVFVNRGDGYGVRMISEKIKISQVILSTEKNPVVIKRAQKLGIPVINNAGDSKKEILQKYCAENKTNLSETLYIGNDLNDYEAMQLCGIRACPSDAEKEILNEVDFVFCAKGGYGVVRELYRVLTEKKDENRNS